MNKDHTARTRFWVAGFTLIEVMLALVVVGVLASVAYPMYADYRDKVNRVTAIQDIRMLQLLVTAYEAANGSFPPTLASVSNAGILDPWGHPYQYTDLTSVKGKGKARKDHKFNPINSDFDLFSMGKDGVFKAQLSNKESADDIVRGRDGAFVGMAPDFTPD